MARIYEKKVNTTAYLKAALYGRAGSGKTYTALSVATGLVAAERAKGNKDAKIFLYDTEHGADYYLGQFATYGPESGGRSIKEVMELLATAAETPGSVCIVDSMSDIWDQQLPDWLAGTGRSEKSVSFSDWSGIKKPWNELMRQIVDRPCHVIYCGRQGDDTHQFDDEESGRQKMVFMGYKMRAEKEALHAAHFCARFEIANEENLGVRRARDIKKLTDPSRLVHAMIVEKDRTNTLDGQTIINPTYDTFMPILAKAGATHGGMQSVDEAAAVGAELHGEKKWTQEDAELELKKCRKMETLQGAWLKYAPVWKTQLGETGIDKLKIIKDEIKDDLKAKQ